MKSRSPSPSPMQGGLATSSSSRNLDSFEQRIAAKSREGSNRGSLASSTSSRNLDDFEQRIAAKSREGNQRGRSPASDRGASTWDDRLQQKLSRSSQSGNSFRESSPGAFSSFNDRSGKDSELSASTFEQRLQRKVSNEDGKSSSREPSPPGAYNSFQDRLAAKLGNEGGKSRSRESSPGAFTEQSGNSFESRLR